MKIMFKPKTDLGRWSVVLIILVPILFYIGMSSVSLYGHVSAGKTIAQDIVARPGVALPMLAAFISGIAAFFCGIIGIIKNRDHSVIIFISTLLGFLVLIWVITEMIFPH